MEKGWAIISGALKFLVLGRRLKHEVGWPGARGQEGEHEEVCLHLRFRVKG